MAGKFRYFDCTDLFALVRWLWRDQIRPFESEFARYVGAKLAIGTSYGRTALYLGLKAIDVRDREVIVPAFVCTVVRHAVTGAGGIPVFADINLDDLTFNLDDLRQRISTRTKAIILIHYFGRVARNLEDVLHIAAEKRLILIEDCAHSLGAEWKGRKVGTFGRLSIFSLTKGMINFGGGILVSDDRGLYLRAREILREENIPLRRRLVDFPLAFAYGVEQAIDKVVFDRVGRSIFKWWLIHAPRLVLALRGMVIRSLKALLSYRLRNPQTTERSSAEKRGSPAEPYGQLVRMEPIIASLGRSQLKKLDFLSERRRRILLRLAKMASSHFKDSEGFAGKDVATFLALRFVNRDVNQMIHQCKKRGLLLQPTWPTHQRLWDQQDTENVRKMEREFLTWTVSPELSKREIDRFIEIITESDKESAQRVSDGSL